MPYSTDYEINYNQELQTESVKAYQDAMAAAKTKKTDKVLQTGNTGPSDTTSVDNSADTEERRLESEADYLEFLELTYPDSIFSIGDFSGDASELRGMGSILLSPALLKKMVADPEFGKEMEHSIAEIEAAETDLRLWYETNHSNVLGHGAVIDADGRARTWSFALEDLNSMQKLESTDSFMKMEELREKAMKLDIPNPMDIEERREHLHQNA